jgi:NAD(P)-dependent dehydrogenase (short-subunit alcohol dehydrogenase family)
LIGFIKSLAREMARYKINVNCICPGPTDTPMLQSRPDKIKDAFIRAIAFRRFAKPQEIANAILVLCEPARRLHHRPGAERQRRADVRGLEAGGMQQARQSAQADLRPRSDRRQREGDRSALQPGELTDFSVD